MDLNNIWGWIPWAWVVGFIFYFSWGLGLVASLAPPMYTWYKIPQCLRVRISVLAFLSAYIMVPWHGSQFLLRSNYNKSEQLVSIIDHILGSNLHNMTRTNSKVNKLFEKPNKTTKDWPRLLSRELQGESHRNQHQLQRRWDLVWNHWGRFKSWK